MRDTRHFSFVPLSPVHVGTGSTIAPEEYIHDGDHLVRVNLPFLLRGLSTEDRAKLETALERGDLKYTRSLVQARARDAKHHCTEFRLGDRRGMICGICFTIRKGRAPVRSICCRATRTPGSRTFRAVRSKGRCGRLC